MATDLVTGAPVLLDRGDLESALLAGAAIPGMLPPVDRAGRMLIDGGLIAYVPVLAALQAGAASVVVVATGPESSPLRPTVPRRRASAIAARAGLPLLHHQIERDLHEVSRHLPTVVLPTGIEAWPAPWVPARPCTCTPAATSPSPIPLRRSHGWSHSRAPPSSCCPLCSPTCAARDPT
ncbi:patatin-like phospholipase family protein [Streptomyces sp. TLI_185]|uniref:patatin-like phospholipase family protein n=1 Tax=Streptomyces sp. TLI_185 TaxID=2485151 RepID=UPI0037D9F38F